MKKFVLIGLLALAFSLPGRADLKIALVDTGKAFDAYYKTQQTAVRIEAKRASYQKEMRDLQAQQIGLNQEAQKLNDEIKAPSTPVNIRKSDDAALAQKVLDLQMLEKEIDQVRQTDTQEMRDELTRSHQEISDEIMKVITAYVAGKGYDLVLDKSSDPNGPASLIFIGSGRIDDLTAEIIGQLNASAPVSPPTAHQGPDGRPFFKAGCILPGGGILIRPHALKSRRDDTPACHDRCSLHRDFRPSPRGFQQHPDEADPRSEGHDPA